MESLYAAIGAVRAMKCGSLKGEGSTIMNLIAVIGGFAFMAGAALWGAHEYWLRHNWPKERSDLFAATYFGAWALGIYLLGVSTHNPNVWGAVAGGCSILARQMGQC